ncbi:Uncharacterized protein PHSC3_000416 [Chlamydiales bacterium STE3]|nr:Uncharacterized protein PHSC3_000416 [Chlamydiales bacterium STE3]
MKYIYQVNGMKCASCVTKIKEILKNFAESAEVTLNPPQVVLEGKTSVDLEKLNTAIKEAGNYELIFVDNPSTIMLEQRSWINTYYPLLIILGMITITSFAGANSFHDWMLHFMAGFFLIFGAFKLLDLQGFRDAYATYDLLANYWHGYGYIYPFLELGLGFSFLFQFGVTQALWFSLILMGFSSLGVGKAILKKQNIRCACLGTTLNLPMSTITLIEDLGMVVMTIAMLAHA